MTGKSLVHHAVPLTSATGFTDGGSYYPRSAEFVRPLGENSLDRLCAEQLEAMKFQVTRSRKTAQATTTTTSTTTSHSDVTPSTATSTRVINRIMNRPNSHKSTTTPISESTTSRGSALSSFARSSARGNQSSVSTRNEESYYSRSMRDDDSQSSGSSGFARAGPNAMVVPPTGDLLPRLGSSGNNLLTATSTITSTTLTSSKPSVSLPTPGYSVSEPKYTGRPRGLVGLQNLGNTCFMNSCLQCVSNLPAVVKYFQSGEYIKEMNSASPTKGALATAFGELIKSLWTSPEFTSTRPVELKRVIGKVASRFTGYDQQDAQEFLRFLLDGLHEDLNRIVKKPPYYEIKDRDNAKDREVSDEYWKFYSDRNQSTLSDLFCGQLRSEIRCHTCNHRSLCFDVFWDLSVPVPKKQKSGHSMHRMFSSKDDSASPTGSNGCSIQDCLKAYTDQELLDESDSYYCSKCKTHRAVSKKISLYRLPQVLVVHLKRFSYSTFSRDKVTTAIKFPQLGLDMDEFCAQDAVLDGSTLYDLAGVVNHVGSLNGGHYTAECVNADTNEWYDFNDSSVSLIKKPQLSSASAYILFFRRRVEKSLTI